MLHYKCRRTQDADTIQDLFIEASQYKHRNSSNYRKLERVDNFIDFYTLHDNDSVIAFSGVYPFNNNLVRVLDSTFYFPHFRAKHGSYYSTASTYFLPQMTESVIRAGKTPFFSMQSDRPHKRIMSKIVKHFNENNKLQYKLLDGYYWTCRSKIDLNNNRCWQTVAAIRACIEGKTTWQRP